MVTEPRSTWTFPLAGGCTVCGVEALGMVVHAAGRRVVHVQSANRPDCVLPNPPAKKAGGQS